MKKIDAALNADAAVREDYYVGRNGTTLEFDVKEAAIECAKYTKFADSIELVSGASFPDIVAAKFYGIEVKSTQSNNWKSIGSSILESTRIADVERIFLTFGKLGKPVEFLSRPYEECMAGIAVTHYPRYQIDMQLQNGKTIFDKMGIPYDQLRSLPNPVVPVAQYYKSRLKPGESLWWTGGVDTAVPVTIRMWHSLSPAEKDNLEATIYVFFPETIMQRGTYKYDRASFWLATQNGIINSNVRDSFSAGGKRYMLTKDNKSVEMPAVFYKISEHLTEMKRVFEVTSDEALADKWGCPVSTNRIRQWINLVIKEVGADTKEGLVAKSVLEKIFE